MIVPLSTPYLHAISEAHIELDPTAFLSQIKEVGVEFREKIFYPSLLESSDCFVWLYLVNNNLAGYIVGTKNTGSFYRRLQRKNPFLLFWLILKAVLTMPQLLVKYIMATLRVEKMLSQEVTPAEILSFGVLPQYRTVEFEQSRETSIAEELFGKAMESFRRWGVPTYKVMTTQENKAANRFYEKRGCRLIGTAQPFDLPCNVFAGEPT